jgi:hypothetical protein
MAIKIMVKILYHVEWMQGISVVWVRPVSTYVQYINIAALVVTKYIPLAMRCDMEE